MSKLNQKNEIPFRIKPEKNNPGIGALQRASRIAEEDSIADMPLNEINSEIVAARKSNDLVSFLTDSLTGILHENNIIKDAKKESKNIMTLLINSVSYNKKDMSHEKNRVLYALSLSSLTLRNQAKE